MIDPIHIKNALGRRLPGASSHRKMLPPDRELHVPGDKDVVTKKSSVLLLLYSSENQIFAILIKRPAHMKHHAGQIALPGGRIEQGETALETALRETAEEIGVTADQIEVLGELSKLYVQVSRFEIIPFVGWLSSQPSFRINPQEVERIIHFPVELFRREKFEHVVLETFTGPLDVPCIQFEDEIIWGATAMILSEFTDLLQM